MLRGGAIGGVGLAALVAVAVWGPPNEKIPAPRHRSVISHGRLTTINFWSQALGVRKNAVLWLPTSYDQTPGRRYPVAYYLHGASGNETNWSAVGRIDRVLDSLAAAGVPEMIVVMPDGDDGWYTTWNWLGDWAGCRREFTPKPGDTADTYCVPWPHYDDYIARDLVQYVDLHFRTRAEPRHRGIAGLSMGGYGAVSLALAYPDVFAAAASHSGVLVPALGSHDATPRTFSLDTLRSSYGTNLWPHLVAAFGKDSVSWARRDPIDIARRMSGQRMPPLFIDCGEDDAYVAQSQRFARDARALGLDVTYHEWPGAHTWEYWRAHVGESAAWLARRLSMPS